MLSSTKLASWLLQHQMQSHKHGKPIETNDADCYRITSVLSLWGTCLHSQGAACTDPHAAASSHNKRSLRPKSRAPLTGGSHDLQALFCKAQSNRSVAAALLLTNASEHGHQPLATRNVYIYVGQDIAVLATGAFLEILQISCLSRQRPFKDS